MTFSLYSATVPVFLQMLGSVDALVNKAEAFCAEKNIPHADIIQARLAADMLPFAYQVKSTVEHSIGAIEAVRSGIATPNLSAPPETFAGLHEKLAAAKAALAELDPAEVDSFLDREVSFQFKTARMDFTAPQFLMSFAVPNFFFHATTAYNILRNQGVGIGKRDFMGQLPLKG